VTYTINGTAQTPASFSSTGSGTASFTTTALTSGNNGQTLVITGMTNTGTTPNCAQTFSSSNSVTLSVVDDPTVQTQPSGTTICAGNSYIISTLINDGTGLGYQWQYSVNGTKWFSVGANLPVRGFSYTNPTSASMTINTTTATAASANYQFRCSISSGTGCNPNPLTTNAVYVNVIPAAINPPFRTWTGMVSTAWENPLNWDCGGVPTTATDVIIPAATTTGNYPLVANTITGSCNTIRIEGPPSTVTVQNGGNLNVDSP
jgi:hypothetical protein